MSCLLAKSSAWSRSRAATAVTRRRPVRLAGLTRAVGAMRAAPRIPILSTRRSPGLRLAGSARGSEMGRRADVSPVWDGGVAAGDGGARRRMSTDANAPGGRPSLGHIPGLDGIRALSVLAIIAFHTGLNSVPGGFYGVDSFFVLSGFLITSLLVKEWGGTGTIRLRRFWAGRARRLLPALFLLVAVMGIVMAVVPRCCRRPTSWATPLSTVFYVSNWYSIHTGVTYFSLSTPAVAAAAHVVAGDRGAVLSGVAARGAGRVEAGHAGRGPASAPVRRRRARRARARAVEVLGGGRCCTSAPAPASVDPEWTRRRRLQVLFAVACFGSLASAILMVFLAPNGYTTRAYYGTDSRAQALLVGAAISIGLTLWREGSRRRWFTDWPRCSALGGVAGTAALWHDVGDLDLRLQRRLPAGQPGGRRGGAGCAVAPRSLVVRLLELPPLPQWGRISYGMYLWYWPVLLVMTGQRLHWGVYPLFLARVGITVAIAALSYDLVEMPIRRGALRALALVGGGADRRGGRHRRGLHQHPGAGGGDGAAGLAAGRQRPTATTTHRRRDHDARARRRHRRTVDARATRRRPRPRRRRPRTCRPPPPPTQVHQAGQGADRRRLHRRHVGGRAGRRRRSHYNVQIANEGTPGCSLSMQAQIKVLWYTVPPDAPCERHQPRRALRHVAQVGGHLQPRRRALRGPRRDVRPGGRRQVAEHRARPPSTATWRAATARRSRSWDPGAPPSC